MHFLPSTLFQEKRHFYHKFCGENDKTFSSKHELRLVNMIQCIQYYIYIVMYPYLSGITMWDECFFLYRAGRPLFVATPCIIRYSQIFCSLCQVTRLFAKRHHTSRPNPRVASIFSHLQLNQPHFAPNATTSRPFAISSMAQKIDFVLCIIAIRFNLDYLAFAA